MNSTIIYNYSKATLQKDIDAFTRRIKLKAHFNNENEPNDGRRKDFYIKSNSCFESINQILLGVE